MYKLLLCALLCCCIVTNINAQKKYQVYQHVTYGNKKKSITGTITKIKNSNYRGEKLTWVFIGDTIIHVWKKDLNPKIAVGNTYKFTGISRFIGYKNILKKDPDYVD
ncbi:MAG: hypothetical protein EOP00_16320 [Pedobacter sp.]|nr:MAG: hypothetical protein EOP00_16320 [Pedobacter sp.]